MKPTILSYLILAIFIFLPKDLWAQSRAVIYPNIIPGAKLQIFNLPGFRSDEDCKPKCKVELSVSYDQQIVATGKKKIHSFDGDDGETVFEEYIEVEATIDQKHVKGWVPSDLTSHQAPDEEPVPSGSIGKWFSPTPPLSVAKKSSVVQICKDAWNWAFGKQFEPSKDDIHSISKKIAADQAREKLPLAQTSKIVQQLIGQCAIDNPVDLSETDLKGPISYDSIVLPKLTSDNVTLYKKEKDETIKVTQPAFTHLRELDIPLLNPQKLIEIDALSRTIFAEMAGCIPIGPQYAMAVARVIKNRESAIGDSRVRLQEEYNKDPSKVDLSKKTKDQNEFLWEKTARHWPGKNLASKIASSPVQFSGWNNYVIDSKALKLARDARRKDLIASGHSPAEATKMAREQVNEDAETLKFYKFNKSGIQHTLCPPSRADANYYKGEKPYPELLAIWNNTVRIAVEATLYPEQFAKKTESLKDVLHYTSGRSSFYGFCPYKNPVVDGKKLDSGRCLNLWIDPDRSPQYCTKEQLAAWNAKKEKSKSANQNSDSKRSPAKAKSKAKKKP